MTERDTGELNPIILNQQLKPFYDKIPEKPETSVIYSGGKFDTETFSKKFWGEIADMERRKKGEYIIAIADRLREHLKSSHTTTAFQEHLVDSYKTMFVYQPIKEENSTFSFTIKTLKINQEDQGGIFDPRDACEIEMRFLGREIEEVNTIAQHRDISLDSGNYDELGENLKNRCEFQDRWAVELFEM